MNGVLKNTFIRLAMVALILFFGILFVTLRFENNALSSQADELKDEIQMLEENINEMKADLARPFDEEYIAEVAEEKLGLRYPQEVVFYTEEK